MATRMPYWKQLLVSGSTAVSLSAAAAAALSAIMPEQRPSEALLSTASADIGAAAYVDTFSTRLGQRSAREKLAAHDGDGLARLFFECTAFAPEAFFLRHFGHRFAAHVEASPPWLFEPAAQFLIWRCESVNTHSVLLRDSVVGSLLLVAKDDEQSSLSLGTAVDSHRMGLVSTAIHRFYCRLLVQSMASLLTRRRISEPGDKLAGNSA